MVKETQTCRWVSESERSAADQTEDQLNGKKEGGKREDMPEGKYGGGGSIHDCQRVKSQFLESFGSCESPFLFLVNVCFL
jgi:hypothetical protein